MKTLICQTIYKGNKIYTLPNTKNPQQPGTTTKSLASMPMKPET